MLNLPWLPTKLDVDFPFYQIHQCNNTLVCRNNTLVYIGSENPQWGVAKLRIHVYKYPVKKGPRIMLVMCGNVVVFFNNHPLKIIASQTS